MKRIIKSHNISVKIDTSEFDIRVKALLLPQDVLVDAVMTPLFVIEGRTLNKVPVRSGRLKNSYNSRIEEISSDKVVGSTGSDDVPYNLAVELGYTDTDSNGRTVMRPAKPHLRPAFDETVDEVEGLVGGVVKAHLNSVSRKR